MMVLSKSLLESLENRATDIIKLAQQYDAESQAILSAKRQFLLIELDVVGLHPDAIVAQQITEVNSLDCPNLAILLDQFRRLNEYASSPERHQWNPNALPGRTNVPISFDWFLASIIPQDWAELDFLSRCERIWRDQSLTGAGLLFTKIFNHLVKFVTGYEDGLRLVLCRVEVEDKTTRLRPPVITIAPIDLTRQIQVYDGSPQDWNLPIKVPMGSPHWEFTLAEIDGQNFAKLADILGTENFKTILETQGYAIPSNEFQGYRGEDNLPLYYVTREGRYAGVRELLIISFGEYQPMHWVAHIEGIWQVKGADF